MLAGSGLGLYIAQLTVELQNREIGIKRTMGEGTTVSVKLPYMPRTA